MDIIQSIKNILNRDINNISKKVKDEEENTYNNGCLGTLKSLLQVIDNLEEMNKSETLKSEIKVIDYLLTDYGGDCCAKCIYCRQADENGDVPDCLENEKDGNIACRKGMIAYYKNNE